MRSIVNFSPWSELNRMWELMDRINPSQEYPIGTSMPIDMYEQDGRLMIRASLPGVKPDQVNLSLDQGVLTISGETKSDYEDKKAKVFHREHTYGSFVRSIRLPEDVDTNEIDAQFDNGILTVSVPQKKEPEVKPKQIPVRSSGSQETSVQQPASTGNSYAYADRPDDSRTEKTSATKQADRRPETKG